ncbi:bifunctional oligoribonuclease and PAP phosphatase NrnA [Candidatus Mycoplasma haematohominis]|uniref:Bifunctional oligoribonuclease and PAP phosphatase NrnA n=1 Tax=Candidatus Mycoplasma haematohominis TaxID=1494318 RepID=A0A478FS67_9MOLU|nr:bifunctional oligoribonuclease and PAP phosphatase NrnA [Candidatus Mycoplasma haemohominis]
MNQRDKDRNHFLKHFQNLVLQFDHIIVFHHNNPDGDCLGSSFGLQGIIHANYPNKRVYVVGSNPNQLYSWMTMKFDNLINYDFDFSNAMAIILDVGQSSRIDCFDKFFRNSRVSFGAVVKIDHHDSVSDFHVDLCWDDPTYASTCCQIVQLSEFYGWKMPPKAATFLYMGICSDSLRFSIDSVVPRTLILAAKTWRNGANYVDIHRRLKSRSWEQIQLSNYLISKAIKTEDVIYGIVTLQDMQKFKTTHVKSMVNVYEHIDDCWIWMLMVEQPNDIFEVSIRSLNASAKDLATKYGGGGHENAAGCRITLDQIQDLVSDAEYMVKTVKAELYYESNLNREDKDPEEAERVKQVVARKNPEVVRDAKNLLKDIKKEREAGVYDVEQNPDQDLELGIGERFVSKKEVAKE